MHASAKGTDVVAMFAKAPVAGHVKTRLAAEVGQQVALRLYRRMGRMTLRAVTAPEWRTDVWFAPSTGGRAVRAWLAGRGANEYRAQAAGDLGARLAATFDAHFLEGAERVIAIGSDCPSLDAKLVRDAFDTLERSEAVLGPALDGGYYLIGLRRPVPALFRSIEWSTGAVLAQTLAAARRGNVSVSLLPPLRDIDTASDALAAGLLTADPGTTSSAARAIRRPHKRGE